MTNRAVMQQALECIERLNMRGFILADFEDEVESAINALREALEQPEQEPVAKVVSTAPDRIWLDLGFDPQDKTEVLFGELHDVTWSQDNASGYGIEYVRATPPLPEQEPVKLHKAVISAWSLREVYFDEDGEPSMHRSPPAAPEQEPVAFYHPHKGFYWAKPTHIAAPTVVDVPPVPLYVKWKAAQRPWQGLTDEEVQFYIKKHSKLVNAGYDKLTDTNLVAKTFDSTGFYKEVSTVLKERNG